MESTRREFVRLSGGVMLAELLPAQLANRLVDTPPAKYSNGIFLEAEQFADTGGWDTDQQSMDQNGLILFAGARPGCASEGRGHCGHR